jgi:hypothetical protein
MYLVATFSGVLIGNDIEHACIIQQISRGPNKGTLHTQLVFVFFLLKRNTTLFQILQIIQLKVISYLDTDHLPFLEKGEGEDGWHDMY